MIVKTCKDCLERKLETAFYFHKQSNTRLNSCKECVKSRVRVYRAENIDRVREYDRERGLRPERKLRARQSAHKYKKPASGWRIKNKEKYKAHIAVSNAVRDGRLKKPERCERCSGRYAIHGHHEDYSKPLDVIWLCRFCHGERHREINQERRLAACVAGE